MIEVAKHQEEKNYFSDSEAFYKLYNTAKGAVFYFENGEDDKVLTCLFEMEMENLYIVGEPKGATKFQFELQPLTNCHRVLKPIVEGDGTGIQMRFEFKLDEI